MCFCKIPKPSFDQRIIQIRNSIKPLLFINFSLILRQSFTEKNPYSNKCITIKKRNKSFPYFSFMCTLSRFNLHCWTYMSKYMTCDSFSSNNINMKSFNYILKRKNCLFLFVLVRWFWKRALNNKFYGRLRNIKPLFKHKE